MKTIFLLRICQQSLKKTLIVTDWKLFNLYFNLIFTRRFDLSHPLSEKSNVQGELHSVWPYCSRDMPMWKYNFLYSDCCQSSLWILLILLSHLKNRNNLSNSLAAYRPAKILNTSCEDRSGTHDLCVKHCSIF